MIAFATGLLEHSLKRLGYDAADLQSLRDEGYLLWHGKNGHTSLLVPAAGGDALFVISTLSYIDPEQDGRLLALALHLNLSPAHTLGASIALDIEQNTLCCVTRTTSPGTAQTVCPARLKALRHLPSRSSRSSKPSEVNSDARPCPPTQPDGQMPWRFSRRGPREKVWRWNSSLCVVRLCDGKLVEGRFKCPCQASDGMFCAQQGCALCSNSRWV